MAGCCSCATATCRASSAGWGTLLGDAGINIADIHLSREPGGDALAVLRLDQVPDDACLRALLAVDEVIAVDLVDLS